MNIWKEIQEEYQRQIEKLGGEAHGDANNPIKWISFVLQHVAKSLDGTCDLRPVCSSEVSAKVTGWVFTIIIPQGKTRAFRKQMIKVAALAAAALEKCE